jgi:hypothetical protein
VRTATSLGFALLLTWDIPLKALVVRRQNAIQFLDHNQKFFVVLLGRNLRTQLVNAITLVFVHKNLFMNPEVLQHP